MRDFSNEYPPFSLRALALLDKLGFEGLDCNFRTSLFEYGGLYSKEHEAAVLVQPDRPNPGISFQRISNEEIAREVKLAGSGFRFLRGRAELRPA
jgi:hypothetical protein